MITIPINRKQIYLLICFFPMGLLLIGTCISCNKMNKSEALKLMEHHSLAMRMDSDKVNQLVSGKFAYFIPDTMRVDSNYKVIVSITKALNDSILFINLEKSRFKNVKIKVSSIVKVLLSDPTPGKSKYFSIQPLNSEEQTVDDKSNTIWEWYVNPLQGGHNQLSLRATVKCISKLGEFSRDIPVFEKTITVMIPPWHNEKQFIKDNWQWIFGTILIPFSIWVFNRKSEKKKSSL